MTEIRKEDPRSERRPILVPVDFSSCSEAALLFAAQLAGCAQAPLVILHVVHDSRRQPGIYRNGVEANSGFTRPLEDIAREMLDDFVTDVSQQDSAGQALAGASRILVSGLPARRIQQVAVHEDAALIVMGSHGRTGLARLAGGSVAGEVVQHSHAPVTIVKGPQPAPGQVSSDVIGSSGWWRRRTRVRAVSTSEESGV